MEIKLNLKERLALISLLPKEGSFKVMARSEEVKKALLFTDEEDKIHGIVYTNDGRVFFAPPQFKDSENAKQLTQDHILNTVSKYEIGETVCDAITDKLKELDSKNKLPADYISLYEMFVENK